MITLKPNFFNKELSSYEQLDHVPEEVFDTINKRLKTYSDEDIVVSIVIAAWNEETNIIRSIDSLSKSFTKKPFEIVVVDNNSYDRTKETLQKLDVKYLFQEIQGCGPARQLGQENAKGKYILMADADCIYPPNWIDILTNQLEKKDVVCVYGNYSFMTDNYSQKIGMIIYESARNMISLIRHIKRPFLNCLGMNMGYVKEYGLKEGFITTNVRGEDGRLAYSLMKYGKVKRVFSNRAKVWTGYRTLVRKGSIYQAFITRILGELSKIRSYMSKIEDHDPKTTTSEENPSAFLSKKD